MSRGPSYQLADEGMSTESFCWDLGALSAQIGAAPSRHSQGRGVG